MADIDRELPPGDGPVREDPTVVVIADRRHQVTRLRIGESPWSTARVVPLVGRSAAELHDELAALSHVGVVVDVRGSQRRQVTTFEQNFFHLDSQDLWVALRVVPRLPGGRASLAALARELDDPEAHDRLGEPWLAHAGSVADVRVTPRLVVIAKSTRHLLRLRDHEALGLLSSREPGLRVTELARLDGGVVDTEGLMTDHDGAPEPRVPDMLRYPVHVTRRYEGPVHLPRTSLVHHGRSVLPDSFRWHLTPQPEVYGLDNVGERFGVLRQDEPAETLPGSYYFFFYNNPGHFGHLMTEAVSKLWGWHAAKAADPSLKILCRLHPRREGESIEKRLEMTLLPAFGIDVDDIVWVDRPVTVTSLVGATPMWHNAPPFYLHPEIRDTWARLRTGLIGADPVAGPPRIFVTRHIGERRCRNVGKVERFFAARGFEIVAPEELSIAGQAAVFAGARVIAGFGGAGMFNLAYAQSVETVIVLNQSAYQARNEHLFAAAHGARFHCFWSRPKRDHPPGGFSYAAHQSPWKFDFDRNGAQLRRVVARLDA